MSSPRLGCIADDLTGATDLASALVESGMRTSLVIGPAGLARSMPEADAIVVALKSRLAPVTEAIALSLCSLNRLRKLGVDHFFFKYCSTFDSTPEGNIGPVADALLSALDETLTIICPALPDYGRTVYRGHLFVGDVLLSDSSMRHHPLNPMTDSRLATLLSRQTRAEIESIGYDVVARGPDAVRSRLNALQQRGTRYAIVDAVTEEHLSSVAEAIAGHRLATGASAIARAWSRALRGPETWANPQAMPIGKFSPGHAAIISGSCSAATLAQVDSIRGFVNSLKLDPIALAEDRNLALGVAAEAKRLLSRGPVLIYSSAEPEAVAQCQDRLGSQTGCLVESALAEISAHLVDAGVTKLIIAGGETAGAVVHRLGISALTVGPEIDPGVPWMFEERGLALALKSGNFGAPDFFNRALA